MKTRDRIIQTAIELINKNGLANITIRELCETLKMSPGNLTYYFPKWQDLLDEIYSILFAELRNSFPFAPFTFESLNEAFLLTADFQSRYMFIFRDIFYYATHVEAFKELRNTLMVARMDEMLKQLSDWADEGLLLPNSENLPHDFLVKHLWLIITNWVSFNGLTSGTNYNFTKEEFVRMIWGCYVPYLTPLGKKKLSKVYKF
jgi:AcrR family transcriptional regulator